MKPITRRVLEHPDFQEMASQKSRLGWFFSMLMLVIYVAYILLIGISPQILGIPVYEGAITTWGIYMGVFVILFAIAITGIYVYWANGHFEAMTKKVVQDIEAMENANNIESVERKEANV